MALNHGQDVVEIMCDTGGNLANHFHFLGLAQLVFDVKPLGDVLYGHQKMRLAFQFKCFRGNQHGQGLPFLGVQFGLQVADLAFGRKCVQDFTPRFRFGKQFQSGGSLSQNLFAFEASQLEEALVDIHIPLFADALQQQGNRACPKRLDEAFLGTLQCFVGLLQVARALLNALFQFVMGGL